MLSIENEGEASSHSLFLEQFLKKTCINILSSFLLFEMYVTVFIF